MSEKLEVGPVWVTRYALSTGIMKYATGTTYAEGKGVAVRCEGAFNNQLLFRGKDWHLSWEAALRRAEEMRDKKHASLKKQIEKIASLKFEEAISK